MIRSHCYSLSQKLAIEIPLELEGLPFGMNGAISANLGDRADLPALARFVNDGVKDGDSAFNFFLKGGALPWC